MKLRIFTFFMILTFVLVGINTQPVAAQAYTTSFTTSITYMNVGSAATNTLELSFYANAGDTAPTTHSLPSLPAGAGASLYIGSLADTVVGSGFRGSAIMSSDQQLLATLVQLPQGSTTVKNRALSNGFAGGAGQVLIATVLKNTYDNNTIFSVQNVGATSNDVDIDFYDTSATLVHHIDQIIEPGASFYVDAGPEAGLGTSCNGSAVVTGTGDAVVGVLELEIVGIGNKAFEGVATGGPKFYMPSGLCEAWGANTAYAVQNTNLTTSTDVTVTYSNGATETQTIGPGAKKSFIACNATGMATGWSGAAVITSATTDVIAIGKAYGSGLTTAFNGVATGDQKVATPYVRWATDANYNAFSGQRTFITIQNVGADIPAGSNITVEYVDKDGNIAGTHTFSTGLVSEGKFNSNASDAGLSEFGYYYSPTAYGGAAIITGPAGSQLAVVARVSTQVSAGQFVSEDYNGQAIP